METTVRPRQHLIAAAKHYPDAWKAYDRFRADRGQGLLDWPPYVFAPIAAAYAIVSGGGPNRLPPERIGDVGRLAALAAWRPTQSIYRFDPALFAALVDTPLSGDLPGEVLHRLPEWAPYIGTPGLEWQGSPLYGFFAHIESDPNDGREELRLLLVTDRHKSATHDRRNGATWSGSKWAFRTARRMGQSGHKRKREIRLRYSLELCFSGRRKGCTAIG